MERCGFVGDARERRDRLRGDVGLLRGDAAVLDREVGRVARGIDALDPGTRQRASIGMKPPGPPGTPGTDGP